MIKKTFGEFVKECNELWNEKNTIITFRSFNELEDVMYDLYDSVDFEVNYEEAIIEIY